MAKPGIRKSVQWMHAHKSCLWTWNPTNPAFAQNIGYRLCPIFGVRQTGSSFGNVMC